MALSQKNLYPSKQFFYKYIMSTSIHMVCKQVYLGNQVGYNM